MTIAIRRTVQKSSRLRLPVPAAVGNFDGVHLGHQALLKRVRAFAGDQGSAVVVSFYPHPGIALGRFGTLHRLTTLRQKILALADCGIDLLQLVHFTPSFLSLSGKEFIDRILVEGCGVDHLVLGPDTAFGCNREMGPPAIVEYMSLLSLTAEIVQPVRCGDVRISSGEVRSLLAAGLVREAAQMLGRPHALCARVVPGARRGTSLGYPTANLYLKELLLPKDGVYAAFASIEGQRIPAVVNVGLRPTFGGKERLVEVHLISRVVEPLYRHRITVLLLERLRDERKFADSAQLCCQIAKDIEITERVLAAHEDATDSLLGRNDTVK